MPLPGHLVKGRRRPRIALAVTQSPTPRTASGEEPVWRLPHRRLSRNAQHGRWRSRLGRAAALLRRPRRPLDPPGGAEARRSSRPSRGAHRRTGQHCRRRLGSCKDAEPGAVRKRSQKPMGSAPVLDSSGRRPGRRTTPTVRGSSRAPQLDERFPCARSRRAGRRDDRIRVPRREHRAIAKATIQHSDGAGTSLRFATAAAVRSRYSFRGEQSSGRRLLLPEQGIASRHSSDRGKGITRAEQPREPKQSSRAQAADAWIWGHPFPPT
jgi:hypothetical protein